jgi:hypothetical protein
MQKKEKAPKKWKKPSGERDQPTSKEFAVLAKAQSVPQENSTKIANKASGGGMAHKRA